MESKIKLFFKIIILVIKKCMNCFYESIKVHNDQP